MPTPLSLRDALRATSRPEAHLSILTKGLLLIAGPLVLQLLLLGVLFTEQRHAVEAERRELRSREVLQQASAIEGMVLEQTAAMRGAVLAGALLPNEARTASDTTVLAQVEALRVLVAGQWSPAAACRQPPGRGPRIRGLDSIAARPGRRRPHRGGGAAHSCR